MTEQRKCLLSFLKSHHEQMVAGGLVEKFPSDEKRRSLYQYIRDKECQDHLHMKCEKFGWLFHMQESSIHALTQKAVTDYRFHINRKIRAVWFLW